MAEISESIRSAELTFQARQQSSTSDQACAICGGDRWIIKEIEGHGRKAFPCECQISARVAARLPALYHTARLTDFKSAAIDRVKEFVSKRDALGLLITGPTGVGKTHLACAIVRGLIETKHEVLFREVSRIYAELRECMRTNQSEEALIAQYANVDWLVLDDFGAGALTDFERRYALDLLNRRANARLRTVVTLNLELSEIAERLDERIASRLAAFDQIRATGKDRRAQK